MAYLSTKLEDFSFNCSKDMNKDPKL